MKIKFWCDSGANIHSCRRGSFDLEEVGYTLEEWRELSEEDKAEIVQGYALDRLDWGWEEPEEDE